MIHDLLRIPKDFFLHIFSRGKLKRTLFGTFFLLLAIVFSVSWFFTSRGLRSFSDASIQDLAERSSRLVFEQFSSYLDSNITLLETNRILFEYGPAIHPDELPVLFGKELESFPALHIVSAGFADGEYAEAQRMEDGSIRYGRAGKETGGDLVWFRYTPEGTKEILDRRTSYDPRKRPWYESAIAAGQISFSDPYNLVSTGSKVIAASKPLYSEQGKVRGVLTVDILLDDIIKTVGEQADEFNGYVLIRDRDGKLIINANREEPTIYSFAPDPSAGLKTLFINGEPYRFLTLEYQGRIRSSWLITVALPETAFRSQLRSTLSNLSLVYMVALFLFSLLVYGIVSAVDTPIRQFTALVSRLSLEAQHSLAFSKEEETLLHTIADRKTELGSLARSFQGLLSQLQATLDSLKQSLLDKDILLKEVHHRVKNNLQVIASLLHLEAENFNDNQTREILLELEEKVYAMSMVHETVYTSDSFSAVPMASYLTRLAESLESYHSLFIPLFISVDTDDIHLPLDRAIPCALILVELVTNAFKYAFNGKTEGHIQITLKSHDEFFTLAVQDDGCGFDPEGAEGISKSSGTGSVIMQGLTEQIKGTLALETGPGGTKVSIHFPR
ncbi:histidine kinase dimerization/phosphoacceptor domain -containing protein [Gracilinema caldarium]|uniref:histidine kinase dimerization/phosphoacceptor domain -containing protein n=1 Tax=Gracilinema caldarium TaxID=215591 RepID=UPI0026F2F779|nr:histidine kinase dimerization/phosphoacceptor domain -containing protein [Gracilinema caldarium]